MSDLVFIAFDSEQKAEEVREKVLAMQKEYLIELGDAVVPVKDPNGRIKPDGQEPDTRPTRSDERADDREVHGHQGSGW
jgi:hypothetical protein